MTDRSGVIAAHYFFLLKEDDDLPRLWSSLTDGAEITAEPFSLDLGDSGGKRHGRGCTIISCSSNDSREVCLGMLPDLAAIEITYMRQDEGDPVDGWRKALREIEADREVVHGVDATVMGESTILVSGETEAEGLVAAAGELFPAAHPLIAEIDAAVAGGRHPLWVYMLQPERASRDYHFLAAERTDSLIETLLPQVDSYIKKLNKTAKYFSHQRQTIIKERLKVDKDVGAILHEHVVAGNGSLDPETLEENIADLSRMFGVLATDTQLVRQSAEQMEKDMHRLRHALSPIMISDGARDEISQHLTDRYESEFANARIESDNLDFSRQNAQAAIEVVRTQVDLLRAGEEAALQAQTKEILDRSLLLQEERLALQVAAGFVEFVLIFYYTLKSWEGVAGHEIFDHVPSLLRLVIVAGVAAGATIGTHSLASAIQNKKGNKGILLAVALIVISLAALVTVSIMNA